MLIRSEWMKIWGHRGFCLFLLLMLMGNFILSLYLIHAREPVLPEETVLSFFDWCREDREGFDAAYQELLLDEEARSKLFMEHMQMGDYAYAQPEVPNRYAPEGFTDISLFTAVLQVEENMDTYPDAVHEIISKAEQKLLENRVSGMKAHTFSNRYQWQVIQRYSHAVENVRIQYEYTHGWEEYLSNETVDLFLFAVIAVMAAIVYTMERQSGFLLILRTTRNGRLRTAFAKSITGLFSVWLIVLLFTLETWCLYGAHFGFSSMTNAVQALEIFRNCPYILSVAQMVLLVFGIKLLVFSAIFLLLVRISMWIGQYAGSFLTFVAFLGINYLLHQIHYLNPHAYGRILNLFSAVSPTILFSRYLGVNIAGWSVDAPIVIPVLYGTVCILSFVGVLCGGRAGLQQRFSLRIPEIRILKEKWQAWTAKCRRKNPPSIRCYAAALQYCDGLKLWNAPRLVLVVLVLLMAKGVLLHENYTYSQPYGDFLYQEYMEILAGEMTAEKQVYLSAERQRIDSASAAYAVGKEAYLQGKLSKDELDILLQEYDYAYTHGPILTLVEEQAEYLNDLASENREGWFVYDTGWKTLLFQPFDWTVFAMILLLYSSIFAKEYTGRSSSGGAYQIIRASPKGRMATFLAKYSTALGGALLCWLLWNGVEVLYIAKNYNLSQWDAPVCSIPDMYGFETEMTIETYLILYYAVRLSALLLLAMMVCDLSGITKSSLGAMVLTVLLTLFPHLLTSFGMEVFRYVDYISLLQGTPLLLLGWPGVLLCGGCVILTGILSFRAGNQWMR